MNTQFESIYNNFLDRITDDMYMELSVSDTTKMLRPMLTSASYMFEFPRVDLFDIDEQNDCYNIELSGEEQKILALYMVVEWLSLQLASVENTRMKSSSSDFSFSAQAPHIGKLESLLATFTAAAFHAQRLYKRRIRNKDGILETTMKYIMMPRN